MFFLYFALDAVNITYYQVWVILLYKFYYTYLTLKEDGIKMIVEQTFETNVNLWNSLDCT